MQDRFGLLCVLRSPPVVVAQRGGMFRGSADDPGIKYPSAAAQQRRRHASIDKLEQGDSTLAFDGRSGYLRTALAALDIPVDSQMLVFSPTSLQARASAPPIRARCSSPIGSRSAGCATATSSKWPPTTRRRAWCSTRSSSEPAERPQFKRVTACLGCHSGGPTLGVPGLLMFSTRPADAHSFARSVPMDHRSPLHGSLWRMVRHRQQRRRAATSGT